MTTNYLTNTRFFVLIVTGLKDMRMEKDTNMDIRVYNPIDGSNPSNLKRRKRGLAVHSWNRNKK